MKFLISIIMVLLLVNLFAQADPTPKAGDESATSKRVNDSLTNTNPDGKYRTETMAGGKTAARKGVQGGQEDCKVTDAKGRCLQSPNSTVADNNGAVTPASKANTVKPTGTPTQGGAVDGQ